MKRQKKKKVAKNIEKCILLVCARQLTDDNYNKVVMSCFWIFGVDDLYQILNVKFIVIFYFI